MWDFRKYADSPALIVESGMICTYNELHRWQQEIGKKMEERKIALIFCKNTVGSLLSYLGCMRRGVVPLLLSHDLNEEQRTNYIKSYKPEYIFQSQDSECLDERWQEVTTIEDYVMYRCVSCNEKPVHSDLALLLTTSGSTGNPKCVRLSKSNIESNAKAICQYLHITKMERAITTLPMNYTYGLSIIHTHLLEGASIVLTEYNTVQKEFWDLVDKMEVTSFAGVPFMYQNLKRFRILEKVHPTIKTYTQAGGKLDEKLQIYLTEIAKKNNQKLFVMYGQTEATARMSYLPAEEVGGRLGSVGIPIPGGQFKIIEGEIVYYGKNVCMGYAKNREDLYVGDLNKGVLYTGDSGWIKDGYLYVGARRNREAKICGKRVNLDDIEKWSQKKMGLDIRCIWEQEKLFLFCTQTLNKEDLTVQIYSEFLIGKRNICIIHCTEFPTTISGKIDYKKLSQEVEKINNDI